MDATVRTPAVTLTLALLAWVGFALTAPPTQAQLAESPDAVKLAEPGLGLDIDALLTDDRVVEATIESNIWSIAPQPGRRLIQIPLTVTPTDQTTKLASPSIKVRGGRFVAWRIIEDERDDTSQNQSQNGTQGGYREQPLSVGSLRNIGIEDLGRLDNPTQPTGQATPPQAVDLGGQLTEDIPVLARDFTVSPEGVIHWQLERAIAGAEVKSGDAGYFLKLRPDRLQALEPKRPERAARQTGGRASGQDSREAAAKRRTEELEYRNNAQAYRELRDQVRKLPDQFQTRLPSRLWAVFEVSDRIGELSFTGGPPMPWKIDMENLTALREIASKSGGSGGNLTAEDFTAVSQMTLMLADEHPLTQRAVAGALGAAQLFGQSQQGDALYRLIDKLLKSGDPQTVQAVTAGLASNVPPSPASLSLLRGALTHLDPKSKLLALGGLLTTQDSDPIGQRQMIETANQMLTDPEGPGVVHVLDQLARALSDQPDAVTLVGSGIRFDSLDEASLDQAIVYTANAAGHSALASEWMEHGLLGSSNPKMVRRTVEILGSSAPGGGAVSMLTQSMIRFAFGPVNEDAANRAKPPLRGIVQIPIDSAGHSVYRVLNAGDPEMRALGWKALRHFQVHEDTAINRGAQGAADTDQPDRLELILDAGFNETVTPPQLVLFLVNQEEPEQATAALVRIVVEGRGPAITQAARALVRSGRQLDQPIQALTPEQRGAFAVRLYEAVSGSSPTVAGLLRVTDSRSPLVRWFAQHVSTSGLPEPGDWATAANGEDNLLDLAASSDPDLASAAVAALVASAGGDEQAARDIARQMGNAANRNVEGDGGLREQWGDAKEDIYTARLTHAAGRYRLVVNLRGSVDAAFGSGQPRFGGFDFPTQGEAFDSAANAPLIKSYNVALIELEADGHSLGLASGTLTLGVSDTRLAITLTDPNELKDFGNDELAKLPLEDIEEPIELLPQKDGSWRGAAPMLDGRSIEVIFDPE